MTTNTILKIVAICVVCAATIMTGCIESGHETTEDDEYVFVAQTLRIPAATPTPIESIYSTIWSAGSITLVSYSYDGEYLDYVNVPFSDEMPYTEYDWNEEIPVQEFVDMVFLGVPYNSVDVKYDTTERPASDKLINKGECTVHADNGYVVMSWYVTATRY
jgi:hypothetical protein